MSEAKFTKGPWKANFDDYAKSVIDILNENKTVIAMVPDQEVHQGDRTILSLEEIEANVHLIAAAPDMYEALKCACDQYCIGYAGDSLVKCEDCIISNALRKARGEEE